MDAAT
jgi:hypothetical protein